LKTLLYILISIIPIGSHVGYSTVDDDLAEIEVVSMLKKVNGVRANGCFCQDTYMPSVEPLEWNDLLYKSALGHAKEMSRYNYFAHYSIYGEDIGDRLDSYGYNWQVAGENLGEGQKNFDEVLADWLESKSHCKMLMNPKVQEMAVAKHGRFWVQHFGKQMPVNYRRVGRK